MKQIIYILTLASGFVSCSNPANDNCNGESKAIMGSDLQQDTIDVLLSQEKQTSVNNKKNNALKDSLVYFSDAQFTNLQLELKKISNVTYQNIKGNYKTSCSIDSDGFIKEKGLFYSNYCKDICESYLIDKVAGVKLVLPSSYDGGIIGLLFSPSCNQFIVYSSYDRSDYTKYYDYRAEIFGFTITQGQGFKTIRPSFNYYTKDWSIDNLTWIDENTLALMLYNGEKSGNDEHINYSYFKTNLKAK